MNCQNLFPGKNKKTIINVTSAELAQKVMKVKTQDLFTDCNGEECTD